MNTQAENSSTDTAFFVSLGTNAILGFAFFVLFEVLRNILKDIYQPRVVHKKFLKKKRINLLYSIFPKKE